MVDEVK